MNLQQTIENLLHPFSLGISRGMKQLCEKLRQITTSAILVLLTRFHQTVLCWKGS
jgi:hypothetical protein